MGKIDKVVITTLLTLAVGWVIYSIGGCLYQWNNVRISKLKKSAKLDGKIKDLLVLDSVRIEFYSWDKKIPVQHFRTETTKKILSILLNDRIEVPTRKRLVNGGFAVFYKEEKILSFRYFNGPIFEYDNYQFRVSEDPMTKFKSEARSEKEEAD